jgi:hypothetical protein
MHNAKHIVKTTSNSRTYKLALKFLRANCGEMRCHICPPNKGHNDKRKPRRRIHG